MRLPRLSPFLRIMGMVCSLVIGGCGVSSPPTAAPPAVTVSNLAGNWLIYGAFPKAVNNPGTQPGMAMSFDVIGNKVLASAAIQASCPTGLGSFGATYAAVLTGTVATDGSFIVSSPVVTGTPAPLTLTVSGTVPVSAGASWAGTFTLSAGSFCTVNQTMAFTANVVQDVSGTYQGTGTLSSLSGTGNPGNAPVGLTLALQQGAPLSTPLGTTTTSSRLGLAGSIQIQGFSCFTKGTTSTTNPSEVEGGPILANFTMDDGSPVSIVGSIDDAAAAHLDVNLIVVNGGSCNGIYSFGLNPLVAHH